VGKVGKAEAVYDKMPWQERIETKNNNEGVKRYIYKNNIQKASCKSARKSQITKHKLKKKGQLEHLVGRDFTIFSKIGKKG